MSRLWRLTGIFVFAFGIGVAAMATAADPWEFGEGGDDIVFSVNTLSHGITQTHDLDQQGDGVEDVDWMVVPTTARHSYEARLSGTNHNFDVGGFPTGAQFERVTSGGTILTEDISPVGDVLTTARYAGLLPPLPPPTG